MAGAAAPVAAQGGGSGRGGGRPLIVTGGVDANGALLNTTEVFDGSSWKDSADMPTPREHLAAVSDGTYVYSIGGRFPSFDKNSAALNGSTRRREMDQVGGHADVAIGGEEPTQVLDVVEIYDISDGKWSTLPPTPTARHAEVVATVDNTGYVIGGANRPTHEGPIAMIEALDFL